MTSFKLYECDVGIKVGGVNYAFTHVNEVTIEDPENNKLTRGSNAGNKEGIAYKEGLREPKRISTTIMGMDSDLKTVLDNCFKNQTRCEFYAISRSTGASKMARNAVLCQIPQQLTLDDTPDSMNVTLMFESFDLSEVFKEA